MEKRGKAPAMLSRPFVITLGLALLSASAVLALGGQDILIESFPASEVVSGDLDKLVIADDGTMFSIQIVLPPTGGEVVRVHRSTDGGSTWPLWGELTDPDPDTQFQDLQAVIAPGDPERLILAYTRWDPTGTGDKGTVKVTAARVGAAAPNWNSVVVDGPSTSNFLDVTLDAFPVEGGGARVHLAYLSFQGATGWHRTFAHSLDGGPTWSAPLVLEPVSSLSYFEQDLASDQDGAVHWIWTERPSGQTETVMYLQSAGDDGALLADWGAVSALETSASSNFHPGLAADPVGDGLLLAIAEQGQVRLRLSLDGGATWPFPDQTLAWMLTPSPAWSEDGPAVAMRFTQWPDLPGRSGYGLARPPADPEGAWDFEPLIDRSGLMAGESAIAADPTHGGLFALTGLLQDADGTHDELWFDAEWRGDPGFGTPEAMIPVTFESSYYFGSPAAGDIDGDGDLEVVYHAYLGYPSVWRFDLETGLATLLFTNDSLWPLGEPVLQDIDGDGASEIFVCNGNQVHGFRGDGTPLPGFPFVSDAQTGTFSQLITGGQVTGFTHGEIVVQSDNGIILLGPDGRLRPGFPFPHPGGVGSASGRTAIGDVNADGQVDLVVPYWSGLAIISNTGQLETAIDHPGGYLRTPSLADLDGDGDLEIALPTYDGQVELIHHTGEPFGPGWPFDTGSDGWISPITLADLTGGPRRELAFISADSTLHIVDADGSLLAQHAVNFGPGSYQGGPIVARLGPDGPAVARGDEEGLMHIFRGQEEQDGWPRDFGQTFHASNLAADLDGDGSLEMVVLADQAMWVLDMGVAPGPLTAGWPMNGARPNRSFCADCPGYTASPVPEPALPPAPTLLHQNAPNPFNPSTTIRFEVPDHAAAVRLRVYDPAGRLVRTLVDEVRESGSHAAVWNGRDQAGRGVASGVYLVRLDVGGVSQMRSMVLAK